MNDLIATIPFGGGKLSLFTGTPPPLASNAAGAVWDDVLVAPAPDMAVLSSPLVDGLVAFDKSMLDFKAIDPIKKYTTKVKVYAAAVDQYSHTLDASRYGIMSAAAKAAPPAPDPSWPAEVQEAHKALYAELPQYKTPDANGQFGYIAGNVFFDSVQLNEAWMAQIEAAQPVRKSAWEKLKGWVRDKDNVR